MEAEAQAGEGGLAKSDRMALCQQVVKGMWEAETEEERQYVHELAEADYQRRQAEYEASMKLPSTPEEYEQ